MRPGRLESSARNKERARKIDIATGLRVDGGLAAPVAIGPACGAVIADPLRSTLVTVKPVPGAIGYDVELAAGSISMAFGSWTTQITFNSFGKGNGRWPVWAVLPDGIRSPASEWRKIRYAN